MASPAPSKHSTRTARATFVLDNDGRILGRSGTTEAVIGQAADALGGAPISTLIEPNDPNGLDGLLSQAREAGAAACAGVLRVGDSSLDAHLRLEVVRGANGDVSGFLASIETPGAAAHEAPEAGADQSTQEAVERLAAGIAHRFNNVLAAILGSIEVLCHRLPIPQRAAALMDTALRAATRGRALTHDLLSYAQIQQLDPKTLDAHDVLERAAERVRATCPPNIAVTTHLAGNVPAMVADPDELISALVHLGDNARDAMPAGGEIRFEARLVRASEANAPSGLPPGDLVCFSVSDSGHGIDPQVRAHVTEPFFTTRGLADHPGMGLSTVAGFVAQSRGLLHIDSAVGRGTTMQMWLPLGRSLPASVAVDAPTRTLEQRAATVLLVDDDELVLLSTSGLLEELGWHVLSANGGSQALEIIAAHPEIDVVLTDQVMPGMTGLELAHALRYSRPELPVVLTSGGDFGGSGLTPPETVRRLVKPYGAQELAAALRRAAH